LAPLLLCTSMLYAQHQHVASRSADIIDGAKTPSLIPDITAWRLWLLAATAQNKSHPGWAVDRQHGILKTAGISDDDLIDADEAISHFRTDYRTLMDSYNKHVNAGDKPSLAEPAKFVLHWNRGVHLHCATLRTG